MKLKLCALLVLASLGSPTAFALASIQDAIGPKPTGNLEVDQQKILELKGVVESEQRIVRKKEAIYYLGRFGKDAVPLLNSLLQQELAKERSDIITSLISANASVIDRRSIGLLQDIIFSNNPLITIKHKRRVIEGLGAFGYRYYLPKSRKAFRKKRRERTIDGAYIPEQPTKKVVPPQKPGGKATPSEATEGKGAKPLTAPLRSGRKGPITLGGGREIRINSVGEKLLPEDLARIGEILLNVQKEGQPKELIEAGAFALKYMCRSGRHVHAPYCE